jgi:DNA-binding CsgD family transcriptional regulator
MLNCAWLRVLPSPAPDAGADNFEIGRMALDLPNVVLGDPGSSGKGAARGIRPSRERFPDLLMLVLTVHTDDPRAIEAACAVMCEHLLQNAPDARLAMIDAFPEMRPPGQTLDRLTPHEVRLLTLLVDGHSYKTAAAALGVSRHTVSFHLRSVYEKLQVHSKSEAVSKALRNRLV